MGKTRNVLLALVLVTGCSGNPFIDAPDPGPGPGPGPGTDPGTGISRDGLPPGTASPTPDRSIVRREAKTPEGNGYAEGFVYDSVADTFSVDGLAFDGGNVYQRGEQVGSLGPFAVYEADSTYADSVTGTPIDQLLHRAIFGVSTSGNTEFAIVRTGSYIPYGFGGFIYQRNGEVTLPVTGQATYSGDYAATRDFEGRGGIEYATGQMTIDIDFEDFNASTGVYPGGVKGVVTDRVIFDVTGQDITNDVLSALNIELGSSLSSMPVLAFTIGPGVLDRNGEIIGNVGSNIVLPTGTEQYETGQYYAVISGDATRGAQDEIVGIIVVESEDPRFENVTVRETGGFIVYRARD